MEIGWRSSRACAPTLMWRVDAIPFELEELTERQSGAGSEVTMGLDAVMPELFGEDNRIELYYTTPYKIRQPLGEHIELDQRNDALLAFAKSFEATMGPPRGAQQPVG
jgi:hypothetical protein